MEFIIFNTRDELLRVSLKHVVYFEADGNYTHIYFSNGAKATILYSLANMKNLIEEKLKGETQPFIRIGKRYIINCSYILQINTLKQILILTSFEGNQLFKLSVSKEALKSLKELYTKIA